MWAGALCGGDGAELGGEGGKEVGLVLSDECGIGRGVFSEGGGRDLWVTR